MNAAFPFWLTVVGKKDVDFLYLNTQNLQNFYVTWKAAVMVINWAKVVAQNILAWR